MTATIIIVFCALLLLAYLFDITSSKTKIPSVILLLLLGWLLKKAISSLGYELPDFSTALPILATIGLVLIVLEGSLELHLGKSKIELIKKSSLGALLPILALALLLSYSFMYFGDYSFRNSLINAIPLCIISSAIAIPSATNLSSFNKEFIIYESSLSDILGVLLFNFVALNSTIGFGSVVHFGFQLFILCVISIVSTIGLSVLLSKINHHVKFVPIILLVILIYITLKVYHLPALIFILLFGLAIGNLERIKRLKWFSQFRIQELQEEVEKFRNLTIEGAFLIRSLFFMLFGYLLETSEIFNPKTFLWAIGIVTAIFIFRAIQLKLSKLPLSPLIFIAPRGLITILLFIAITPDQSVAVVNKSLIIQIIILSSLLMAAGLMIAGKDKEPEEEPNSE